MKIHKYSDPGNLRCVTRAMAVWAVGRTYQQSCPRGLPLETMQPPRLKRSTSTTTMSAHLWSPNLYGLERPKPHLLRLSVTERCNFRCPYCAPPKGFTKTSDRDLPSLDTLARVAIWLKRAWNVNRIRITGGEPLIRPGLIGLIRRLTVENLFAEVSLTTNGSRLHGLALPLKKAGLRRVNVSLDTLDPTRFRDITGGELGDTLQGIETAIESGLSPVKINVVLQRNHWREDVPALIQFAQVRRLEVRFIELLPIGPVGGWSRAQFISAVEVMEFLKNKGEVVRLPHQTGAPAREMLFRQSGNEVKIGWITPKSEAFCEGCNRLRLDSHGRLRRCLMDPQTLDLAGILSAKDESEAAAALEAYMFGKHPPEFMRSDNLMVAVGG